MQRLNNSRTIAEIEAIAGVSRTTYAERRWLVGDVECSRDSHRFSGPAYAFTVDILQLRRARPGRPWHVMIATELWRGAGDTDRDIRGTKWLTVVSGKATDVTDWVRANRKQGPP